MLYTVTVVVVLVQLLVGNHAIYIREPNAFFRKDYTFLKDTQSFYKIHTIFREWGDAKRTCQMEGATMFYPEDDLEAESVLAFWNKTQPYNWVYVGISDLLVKGVFQSIDGKSINDIYHVWSPNEPNNAGGVEDCVVMTKEGKLNDDGCNKKFPFICKKTLASMEWNVFCDLPDLSYLYNRELGKCYKFHNNPMNWTQAYVTCSAEDSYLAVINSQKEADYLVKLTEETNKNIMRSDYMIGHVHLGIHNRFGEGWTSIKGMMTIDQTGYTVWGCQQPDNAGGHENCGGMFYNGHLNDINCDTNCFFICEHDISLLTGSVDERMGIVNGIL